MTSERVDPVTKLRFLAERLRSKAGATRIPEVGLLIADGLCEVADQLEADARD